MWQTDRQTDRRTENTIHRAAWSQLKKTPNLVAKLSATKFGFCTRLTSTCRRCRPDCFMVSMMETMKQSGQWSSLGTYGSLVVIWWLCISSSGEARKFDFSKSNSTLRVKVNHAIPYILSFWSTFYLKNWPIFGPDDVIDDGVRRYFDPPIYWPRGQYIVRYFDPGVNIS